ncbi:uncharacterized protein BT62DRAFT_945712 [Guyanagaster necrorhizus]|uniref:Uncharacterized protein n=1 Tax=Guyanagaster necrorhizus TaxID=856835 RepID=A0A9P8AVL0_9AGAR|nr:uncharacterized protein BT62DRAFT_945712 [Guyanagaster necrorhizus MCA 3950]KAG7449435.1 hypothetical protein BT62DRAFT_945712 [Guyanagaster necrorhizus MCA 3950]
MGAPFSATGIKACHVNTLRVPHPVLQDIPSLFTTMCYYRQVRNIYTRCGHGVTDPDEEIRCNLVNCKFSTTHPRHCRPPACTKTCWQYRQYPQQYSPNINGYCPQCRR